MGYSNVLTAFLALLVGAVVVSGLRGWRVCGWISAAFVALATVLAWADALKVLAGGSQVYSLVASMPRFGSELSVSLDALGAAFVLLITGVSLAVAVYSVGYMQLYEEGASGRFYALLQLFTASMIGVVCVADWLFFIVFWELMTLASYFLVTHDRSDPDAVRAGYKYFIMTHVATAGLLVTAVVLWRATDAFTFQAHAQGLGQQTAVVRSVLLALYLLAFSTKAGVFPMGDWVRDAYPAAPSSVSALMSGVTSKLGAYGVLRVFVAVLPQFAGRTELLTWGVVIAALGTLSAFVAAVTAMRQRDAKRLLAFSSMSQIGYVFLAMGIGVAFAERGTLPPLSLLGVLGAGFHILNDAVYKCLLFMSAGSVELSAGTLDLNRVGGLSAVMPVAAAAGLVGVCSLSGLPPTNGFTSKWLIYQASVSAGLRFSPFLIAAVAAFFVSLATLAYSLRFYSAGFLGKTAAMAKEPQPIPWPMSLSQGALAVICLVIGLSPYTVVSALSKLFGESAGEAFRVGTAGALVTTAAGVVPAAWSPIGLTVGLVVCFLLAELIRSAGRSDVRRVPGWYGGEEHSDDEVRFRAQGLYSPFNVAFTRLYPRVPLPRIPALSRLRSLLDTDRWLYSPLVRGGSGLVDKVSRSHVGTPQLYIIWQVAGMAIVLGFLFALVR
ncbi:MAG: proton-conducting transporter transmembrane domain-containing protein [Armatimonadota bacterium]